MKLKLKKPLVVFDLETTGLDLVKDRIIQISYIKVSPDGSEKRGGMIVNPGRPIPPEVAELTGISNADVAGKPMFKEVAAQLEGEFKGCDFAGFNSNHFDIPMLAEEFLRAAHRADQDTEATYRVLMGELDKYSPEVEPDATRQLQNDVAFLAEFSRQNDNVDFAGRIIWAPMKDANGQPRKGKDGQPIMIETFNFGKHKGEPVVQVLRYDPGYFSWIMGGDFTYNTKQVLTRIRLREAKK